MAACLPEIDQKDTQTAQAGRAVGLGSPLKRPAYVWIFRLNLIKDEWAGMFPSAQGFQPIDEEITMGSAYGITFAQQFNLLESVASEKLVDAVAARYFAPHQRFFYQVREDFQVSTSNALCGLFVKTPNE